ncbi:MAG: pirin family protein [Spirochaetales bacterium]|nr:pirin family protein [Spirochaetales bacterium]
MSLRPVKQMLHPRTVQDGDGVTLNRVFSHGEVELTDPFLMMDHFVNDDPENPMPGFPWHPHRGIETITYILEGTMQHEDSLGNNGMLRSGDVQWMTAGSGIVHQEIPRPEESTLMHGFQLWANLPAADKMMNPRYQDIPAPEIPEVTEDDGSRARIITGDFRGKTGPVTGIVTNPSYVDIYLPPGVERSIKIDLQKNAFAYIFQGSAVFRGASHPQAVMTEYVNEKGTADAVPSLPVENRSLVLFDTGDEIRLRSGEQGVRFLLISGQPLKEPVAWHGPIVMNTQEELYRAFEEYRNGTFLKHRKP